MGRKKLGSTEADNVSAEMTDNQANAECEEILAPRIEGKVLWFDIFKNFGFLRSNDGLEYFFHRTSVENYRDAALVSGTPVSFEVDETDSLALSKHRANNIRILDRASERGKPLLTAAFMVASMNVNIEEFTGHVTSKILTHGLKYITVYKNFIFATDREVDSGMLECMAQLIWYTEKLKRGTVMYTNMTCDVLFV